MATNTNINLQEQQKKQQQNVEEAVSRTERFFNENRTLIYGCLIALLVAGLGILCWSRFYVQPKKAEASAQLFHAEQSFAEGNYQLALEGDDNYPGFIEIIDRYGKKAGKAIYMYAGVSELQVGNYQEAISYLKKYKGGDHILSARATACIGDAFVGLEDYGTAIGYFEKAAKLSDDQFSAGYLLKAGAASEALGDKTRALSYYKEIKEKYPRSIEGADIDKYITRIETAE